MYMCMYNVYNLTVFDVYTQECVLTLLCASPKDDGAKEVHSACHGHESMNIKIACIIILVSFGDM